MQTPLKYITILNLLLLSICANAHQPELSSTILAYQGKNNWILQVRAAMTGFESEIENQFGKSSYTTPEEFQSLAIRHLKDNISIQFNDDKVELRNGRVNLGHETSVTFEVAATLPELNSIAVTNTSFNHIHNNQSAFLILKEGLSKKQFTLNDSNNHSVKLNIRNSELQIVSIANKKSQNNLLIFSGLFIAILFVFAVLNYKPGSSHFLSLQKVRS